MRVSTAQFFYQNSQQLGNKQSDVNNQIEYLSSGKRVLTAKDDAVAYGTLTGYKDELANIEKYQRNITQAKNRNSLQDISFTTAEDILQRLKQQFIQAKNGAIGDAELKSLANLVLNSQEQMLDIANSKDETGGYIFAGYQTDKEPFALQADNSVTYLGDSGVREIQIGRNVTVPTNQSGELGFLKVANNFGDFSPVYNTNTSGISLNQAVITDRGAYNASGFPPNYTFTFASSTDLTVTDNNGATVYSTTAYVAGQKVAFNGVEVQISGKPLPGDEFELTPQENVSVFDTMKSIIDWLNVGANPADKTQHDVDYGDILAQLETALNHMTSRRADVGVRMQLIDNQENHHLDRELSLSSGASKIEDLDFAKAISTFEQSKVALQAAQQAFVQIKGLSLFNYL